MPHYDCPHCGGRGILGVTRKVVNGVSYESTKICSCRQRSMAAAHRGRVQGAQAARGPKADSRAAAANDRQASLYDGD